MRLARQTDRTKHERTRIGASAITNVHQVTESRNHWNKASDLKGGSNIKEDAETCLKDGKAAFRKANKPWVNIIDMRQRVANLQAHSAKLRGHLEKMVRSEWAVQAHDYSEFRNKALKGGAKVAHMITKIAPSFELPPERPSFIEEITIEEAKWHKL